jgi:hypothetical protein
MALFICETEDVNSAYSISGAFTNPLSLTFDGVTGGVLVKKLYLANDSVDYVYAGITVSLVDDSPIDLIGDTEGFSWKMKAGSTQPLEEEWTTIVAGDSITISGVDASPAAEAFWIRVEVPRATDVQSFDQLSFQVSATETEA